MSNVQVGRVLGVSTIVGVIILRLAPLCMMHPDKVGKSYGIYKSYFKRQRPGNICSHKMDLRDGGAAHRH